MKDFTRGLIAFLCGVAPMAGVLYLTVTAHGGQCMKLLIDIVLVVIGIVVIYLIGVIYLYGKRPDTSEDAPRPHQPRSLPFITLTWPIWYLPAIGVMVCGSLYSAVTQRHSRP